MEVSARGQRVYLKSLEKGDAAEMAKKANSKEIARYIGRPGEFPSPYSETDAIAFIDDAAARLRDKSAFHFGIRLNGGGLIGVCGVHRLDYSSMKGEIGYWLGREHWGKGYAREALTLLLGFCFNGLRLNRVTATAFSFNERSIRLLNALNFVKEGTLRQNTLYGDAFIDDIVFGILADEYGKSTDVRVKIADGSGEKIRDAHSI
jgi:hypothetical protein